MTIVITCGPAWEAIDGMRRLTNASTGQLGAVLADALADAGHRVLLYRGDGATAKLPMRTVEMHAFSTNDDLAFQLAERAGYEHVHAFFHAAALCDFRVARITDSLGVERKDSKIPSRAGRILLELEPATKVLPQLRRWWPEARIVGWKYELGGSRDDALAAAWRQLHDARTDVCVLNGSAWGAGFAWCEAPGIVIPCPDAAALGSHVVEWLQIDPRIPT